MFILLPHLIDSLGKYKILGGKHFSLRILKALLHCSLACSAAVEKPMPFSILLDELLFFSESF